jgi:thymidine phosphorylase
VCKSEGFEARSRIEIWRGDQHIIATLNVVHEALIEQCQLGLSEAAWRAGRRRWRSAAGGACAAGAIAVGGAGKIYGRPLGAEAAGAIIRDVVDGRYSDIEMAALITACSGERMDVAETIALTRAMVAVGQRLDWQQQMVLDKHCVGGLPGNRTTLLVVPIVAACGLLIPKTSSRAITSPAGTADTMETLAPVASTLATMRRVVEQEGGCVVWGGRWRSALPTIC